MSVLVVAGLVLLAFIVGLALGVRFMSWRYQRIAKLQAAFYESVNRR